MLSKTTSELPFTKDKVAVEASAVKVLICVIAPLKEEITSVIALIELLLYLTKDIRKSHKV